MSKKQKNVETKKATKTTKAAVKETCVCCQCVFRECGSVARDEGKSGWCGKIRTHVRHKDERANDCENFNRKPTKK